MIKHLLACIVFSVQLVALADTHDIVKAADLSRFVKNAEVCEHFAGEWDPDLSKSYRRIIEKSIDKYCGSAYKQRKALRYKYKGNGEALKVLDRYESVNNYSP